MLLHEVISKSSQNNCNLKYQMSDHMPNTLRNLSGSDTQLFIKVLGKKLMILESLLKTSKSTLAFNMKIKVKLAGESNKDDKEIRKNIQLRFMDICRFMLFSLDKLASNLDDDQCEHLKKSFARESYHFYSL